MPTNATQKVSGSTRVVVGVDGGGSTTSVLVADRSGTVLATAEGDGANPQHNPEAVARDTVRETITRALTDARREPEDVAALTAGFAGLNDESDLEWATSFVDVVGLGCEPLCVNDAVVAHAGALLGEPGIVPICGTGSIIFAITGEGRVIRNYDLDHYAYAAARHLGRRAVHELLADRARPADQPLVDRLLTHWDLDSVDALGRALLETDRFSTEHAGNRLDSAAPLLTEAAAAGTPLARNVCNDALEEVVLGIQCVGQYLEEHPIPVAPAGSVLRSAYMHRGLRDRLESESNDGRYEVVEPAMNPVGGAAFVSLQRLFGDHDRERAGVDDRGDLDAAMERLEASPACRP